MLDDEKLAYSRLREGAEVRIRNICIHKGPDALRLPDSFANWRYAAVDDLGKAARTGPTSTSIYHSALRPFL